jgi:general secretion pathway protein M
MTEATSSLTALRSQAAARWQALGARERLVARVALVLIVLGLIWAVALAPALRTLREAPAQLDALDAQLQAIQRQAAEVPELRAAPPVATAQALEALKSATDRLGAKGKLNVQGDRVVLTLTGASGETLRAWLNEARSGARARPLEAQLTRGPEGYSGSVVLALPGGG